MFLKQGVGGRAGAVKKAACIGRDRNKAGGGFCRQGKKVSAETLCVVNPEEGKTYGRKNMNVGVGSPKWAALVGVNTVNGVTVSLVMTNH